MVRKNFPPILNHWRAAKTRTEKLTAMRANFAFVRANPESFLSEIDEDNRDVVADLLDAWEDLLNDLTEIEAAKAIRRKKNRARRDVAAAVKKGILIKPSICENPNCQDFAEDAHHEDYNKPLDVIWLCKPCHGFIHRKKDLIG